MPRIQIDDEVYEELTGYARLWGQTAGQAVATLVRLIVQPVHTVDPPPADAAPTGVNDACEGQP